MSIQFIKLIYSKGYIWQHVLLYYTNKDFLGHKCLSKNNNNINDIWEMLCATWHILFLLIWIAKTTTPKITWIDKKDKQHQS